MFERYTEKARRTIFFARYEASQFGSSYIEPQHLLLGLFREDKALVDRFLASYAKVESIRASITQRSHTGVRIAISVDLPLDHESKRVLAYAAEESERLKHEHIGTPHFLLGLLREEKSFAAQLLREHGLTLDAVREQVLQSETRLAQGGSGSLAGLDRWLAQCEARAGIWIVKQKRVGNRSTHFAIYERDQSKPDENTEVIGPAEKLAQIRKRIGFIMERMEQAIANHEFEKARFYSDEEQKERNSMRLLCEQRASANSKVKCSSS
jgi:hypothetical protein